MGGDGGSFGEVLRTKRLAKGISLRRFAELVGISPTYLSQVEQGNADPPTAERVGRMAELLNEDPNQWIAMAGRMPDDISAILKKQPVALPELLREVDGMTPEPLQRLREQARELREED